MIESVDKISCHFKMLFLVFAHRNIRSTMQNNIGGLQYRISQ